MSVFADEAFAFRVGYA